MHWRPFVATGTIIVGLLAGNPGGGASAAPQDGSTVPEASAPPPPVGEATAPEAPSPEPSIHPDAVSVFLTRTYKIKPKKLWAGIKRTLQDSGYPPEEVDESRLAIKTSFVDFEGKNFPAPVGEAPPEFGPDYPILQLLKVTEGKMSLEAIIIPAPRGSTLSLRARILVHGLNRRERTRVLTDRRSSGVIEKAFLARLENDLGLKPL